MISNVCASSKGANCNCVKDPPNGPGSRTVLYSLNHDENDDPLDWSDIEIFT